MGHLRISTVGQLFLGLCLLGASSCVPQRGGTSRVGQAVPPPAPRQLLRDLALDVPDDVPGLDGMPAGLRAAIADDRSPVAAITAPPFLAQARSDGDAARATDCLTAAVYYEARSEATDGQRAVAQVVLNRVRDRAFPHSVCGVVYQGSTRRTGCQFSFTCDGSMLRHRDPYAWARARSVAEAALAGDVYAPVGRATFYHTSAILPWWASSLSRIGSVGAHIFYRWRGAMDDALSLRAAYAGVEPGVGAGGEAGGIGSADDAGAIADAGVTVHRGTTGVETAAAAAAGTNAPVAAIRMVAGGTRATLIAGVRVHLGSEAPHRVVTDGATVGEETDPI